jgi:hypothetical protein
MTPSFSYLCQGGASKNKKQTLSPHKAVPPRGISPENRHGRHPRYRRLHFLASPCRRGWRQRHGPLALTPPQRSGVHGDAHGPGQTCFTGRACCTIRVWIFFTASQTNNNMYTTPPVISSRALLSQGIGWARCSESLGAGRGGRRRRVGAVHAQLIVHSIVGVCDSQS